MDLTAAELAAQLGLETRGTDPTSVRIRGVNTLEKAGPDELSFLANPKYGPLLADTRAGAVIVSAQDADKVGLALVSENPYLDFARAMQLCVRTQGEVEGVHELAFVDPEAVVEEGCDVYPFAFVGPRARLGAGSRVFPGCYVGEDCRLGRNCTLYPNVTLMAGVRLGDRVTVHAGTVLGADGFGYAPSAAGLQKIPQVGGVVVGDDVEIGANTAIDRAALDQTRIGSGTKIDNLVQVAHNVEVGEHSVIVSQVGVSGSTKIGSGVTLAGQCGIAGHLNIGDGATLGPMTGVAKDIPAGATMGGIPAMDKGAYLRVLNITPKLPDMYRRLRALEKEVEVLRSAAQGENEND